MGTTKKREQGGGGGSSCGSSEGEKNRWRLLPPEILMEEILWRFPVQPLVRFRSVCKPWNSLISSDPNFSIRQLKNKMNSPTSNYFDRQRVVIWDFHDHSSAFVLVEKKKPELGLTNNYNNDNSSYRGCFAIETIGTCPPIKDKFYLVVASCDGLVCVRTRTSNAIFFWNPLTGETKEGMSGGPARVLFPNCTYGLGYDSSTDDYKLVWIRGRIGHIVDGLHSPKKEVRVYSLRTNSWRQVEDFPPSWQVCCRQFGVCHNGSLYWPVYSEDSPDTYKLVSFDLAKEEYGLLDIPGADFRLRNNCHIQVGILDGKLRVYYPSNTQGYYNLLLLNVRDNGESSWTKYMITVPTDQLFTPLCLLKNGEEVLMKVVGVGLGVYHLKDCTLRHLQILGMPGTFEAMAISESLISPNTFQGMNN